MSYLGNLQGPRESQTINRLGANYFGCTQEGLESDISFHEESERRNEVVLVHIDKDGNAYVIFSSSDPDNPHHFYLEENGYSLFGEIITFSEDEAKRWNK